MATLRCTSKYRKAFGIREQLPDPETSDLVLGEWYANTLSVGRQRFFHYVASKSLLSIVIPMRERKTAELRFIEAVEQLLHHFGASRADIEAELRGMTDFTYARASNRSVLGSMRDQAYLAKYDLLDGRASSLWELWIRLAETPCGPMDYNSPKRVTRILFGVESPERSAG
jgi:hypothetical protein